MLPPAGSGEQTGPSLPPNGTGQPVGALSVGDHFQTDGGSVFKVTGKPPSGIVDVQAVHVAPGDPVGGTNDFGPTYVPAGVHPGGMPASTEPAFGPATVQPGDHFVSDYGTAYKVLSSEDDGDGGKILQLKALSGPEKGQVIDDYYDSSDLAMAGQDENGWTPLSAADAQALEAQGGSAGAPEAPKPSELNPYSPKSQTGGGYFFGTLGAIQDGTRFTDKSGTVYEKVGSAGGQHVFKDLAGTHYQGAGHEKVKLLDGAGGVQKTVGKEAGKLLQNLDSIPEQKEPKLLKSPYDMAGKVVGKPLADVKPGEKFSASDGSTYELLAHKNGWTVYRLTLGAGLEYAPVKVKPAGLYAGPAA